MCLVWSRAALMKNWDDGEYARLSYRQRAIGPTLSDKSSSGMFPAGTAACDADTGQAEASAARDLLNAFSSECGQVLCSGSYQPPRAYRGHARNASDITKIGCGVFRIPSVDITPLIA